MAAQICLKTDVGTNFFSLSTRIIRETLSNKRTPGCVASRMLIGLNLTSCQIEISWQDSTVSFLDNRNSLSASVIDFPGICVPVTGSQTLCWIHHSHISLTSLVFAKE